MVKRYYQIKVRANRRDRGTVTVDWDRVFEDQSEAERYANLRNRDWTGSHDGVLWFVQVLTLEFV